MLCGVVVNTASYSVSTCFESWLGDELFWFVLIFLMPYGVSSFTLGIIYGLVYRGFHLRQGQDTTVLTDLEACLVSYAMCPVDALACNTMAGHSITSLIPSRLIPKYGICRTVFVFPWCAVVTWCLGRRLTTLLASRLKTNKNSLSVRSQWFVLTPS
jgi:hypothetical protein